MSENLTLTDLLQKYVDLDYEELLTLARKDLGILYPVFTKIADDNKDLAIGMLLEFLSTALGADNQLSELECKFMCDLLELEPDEVAEMVKDSSNEDSRQIVDMVFDAIDDPELKAAMMELVVCCVSIDEHINPDEIAFILRLLN